MPMDRDKIREALDEINDIVCSCRNGKNGYISEIDLMDIQSLLYDLYSECELDCPDDVTYQSAQSNNAHKSVDLKPCPFCGGESEISLHQERDDYGNLIGFPVYVVCCDTCGAEVIGDPEKQKSADPEEMLRIAKRAWNTRI